jgi:uncharacterized glyoxalase superfamily protein PhnB
MEVLVPGQTPGVASRQPRKPPEQTDVRRSFFSHGCARRPLGDHRSGGRENIMAKVKPIPEGNHSVTAALVVRDGKKAIEFYKTAFGAKLLSVMNGPDGQSVMHAELKIGDTKIYLGDESPDMGARSPQALGGSPVSLNIYTEDCDAMFKKAIAAGGTVKMPLDNMFWGDRYGKITDPFGHEWGIATHVEDVSEAEMEKRGKEWFATMAKK